MIANKLPQDAKDCRTVNNFKTGLIALLPLSLLIFSFFPFLPHDAMHFAA